MVFRVENHKKDYTVLSNHHLRNVKLSLKAKGLLTLMLSLPDNWDFSLRGLASICADGVDAIGTGVKELENEGYVTREQKRNSMGRLEKAEYIVRELPVKENRTDTGFSPQRENPVTVNPDTEKPLPENHAQLSIKELNTKKTNTYQSIEQPPTGQDRAGQNRIDRMECFIKSQIEYDILVQKYSAYQDQLCEIVEIMLEVACCQNEFYYIGKEKHLAALVQRRYSQIDASGVEYVLDCLQEVRTDIRDIKSYLAKSLFNAMSTMSNYYQTLVQRDLGL